MAQDFLVASAGAFPPLVALLSACFPLNSSGVHADYNATKRGMAPTDATEHLFLHENKTKPKLKYNNS